MPKGRMFKVNEKAERVVDPPKHTQTNSFPLISPKSCGANFEFHITEIKAGGTAQDDVHANEEHGFYCISGRALAMVDGEEFLMEPGCALWVPKGAIHSFKVLGGETYRVGVIFSPARKV